MYIFNYSLKYTSFINHAFLQNKSSTTDKTKNVMYSVMHYKC